MQERTDIFKIFSIIAYIRNFFKEEFFMTQKENGIRMKILQDNNETKRYLRWTRLIDENYNKIERIVLGIWLKNNLIEKYIIDKKSEYLIKRICRQIEKWPMLYGKINLKIKLYSFFELELEGFSKKNEKWDIEECEEYEIEGIKLYRKRNMSENNKESFNENFNYNNNIINDNNNIINDKNDIINDKNDNNNIINDKNDIIISINDDSNSINSHKNDNSNGIIDNNAIRYKYNYDNGINNNIKYDNNKINNDNIDSSKINNYLSYSSNNKTIKCICCINNNDGDIMQCSECKNWLHTHCAGFFSNKDKRVSLYFKCVRCNDKFTIYQRNLGIYRRALGIIYNENFDDKKYLRMRLGISKCSTNAILKQLQSDEFVKYENLKYIVQKTKSAKDKLKKYFCGIEMECTISIEDIELECE